MPREKRSDTTLVHTNMWRDTAKRAVYSGLVAGLGGYFLLGETGEGEFLGKNVMMSTAVAGSVAVGSVVSDLASDCIISSMDQSYQTRAVESGLIKASVCGLGSIIALKGASDIDPSLVGFATGAVSKVIGDSVYTSYDPVLLGMLF